MARSTRVAMQCLLPEPLTVSISQWPIARRHAVVRRYVACRPGGRIAVERLGTSRKIAIKFSERIATPAVQITAATRTLAIAPAVDDRTLTWAIPDGDWLTFVADAPSIEIAVRDAMRFVGWGDRPLQGGTFVKTLTVSDLDGTKVLYDVPDLYLQAREESLSQLLFDFHALPFREPATSLVYVRARWLDTSTGSFLTSEPMGYEDASNLYAYAGNDPISMRDPRGEIALVDNLVGGGVSVLIGWA